MNILIHATFGGLLHSELAAKWIIVLCSCLFEEQKTSKNHSISDVRCRQCLYMYVGCCLYGDLLTRVQFTSDNWTIMACDEEITSRNNTQTIWLTKDGQPHDGRVEMVAPVLWH